MVFSMFFHFVLLNIPIMIAIEVDNNKAIWLGPAKDSSPYIYTLDAKKKINVKTGRRARKNDISEFDLIGKGFIMIVYLLHNSHNPLHNHIRIHNHIRTHNHIHNCPNCFDNR